MATCNCESHQFQGRHAPECAMVLAGEAEAWADETAATIPFPTMEEIHVGGIAVAFHETYERLAPEFGWVTQGSSRGKDWMDLPKNQKQLMEAVIAELIREGVIQ